MRNILLCFTVLIFGIKVNAKDFYVSNSGDDSNKGTIEKPFKTIKKAVKAMRPGDVCYIRAGVYTEQVHLNNLKGSSKKPFVFKAYQDEKVQINGTKDLRLNWRKYQGNIYVADLKLPVWQLFADGKSMTAARWPNGNWYDNSVWDKTTSMAWPEKNRSTYGHHYNSELSAIPGSLEGAIILVNSGSFKTYATHVIKHKKGDDNFVYDTSNKGQKVHFSYKGKTFKHGYFLEGKLCLLDQENEWFYDVKQKKIYLWAPGGINPNSLKIAGKIQSYAFELTNSQYVKIQGLNFFGTTVCSKETTHFTLEDCNFSYPSYSKRMLNDLSLIDVTSLVMKKKDANAYNTVLNCKFEYMDGAVLELNGAYNRVENNLMHSIDYSCVYKGGYTLNMSQSRKLIFRRNTVHTTGASEMYKAGIENLIEFNDLSKSGYLQNDGSLVQVSVASQNNSITRYNWVHDTSKQGLRFDNKNTPNAPWGENGTMHHNVAWKTDRIYFKGDKHFIYNNLSFDSHQNDLIVSSNVKIQGHNHKTITRNNLSNKFSGNRTKPGKDYPVPGIVDHNWSGVFKGKDIRTQLRDPDNLDFRPREHAEIIDAGAGIKGKEIAFVGNAPDIGAYEFGAENYWIPGFKDESASVAVPPHKSITVKKNADLMWLEAYKSDSNDVYFGTDFENVNNADTTSATYKGNQKNNIYTPTNLEAQKTYFWRIDTRYNGVVTKGEVWMFTVE